MNKMEIPVYDGKESVNKYLKRIELYNNAILKEKYVLILNFINELTKNNYKALTDFKDVNEKLLLKDSKHNHAVIRKYCEIFENKFKINFSVDGETDSDDINDTYIFFVMQKVLININYILLKSEVNGNSYLSILKK